MAAHCRCFVFWLVSANTFFAVVESRVISQMEPNRCVVHVLPEFCWDTFILSMVRLITSLRPTHNEPLKPE